MKLLSNLYVMIDANAFLDQFLNNLMKLCLKLDVFFCKFKIDVMIYETLSFYLSTDILELFLLNVVEKIFFNLV